MKRIISLGLGFLFATSVLFVGTIGVSAQNNNSASSGKQAQNFIAKFRGRGTSLEASAIFESGGHVGINTNSPKAPLEAVSQFVGGGPTLVVGNAHDPGVADIAIDFEAGGQLFGNIAMVALDTPGVARLLIMQNNPSGANVTLLEEGGGYVGIGTPVPQATFHMNFGGTADQDELLIGDPGTKGFRVRDTGDAIDLVSIGVPLYVNSDTQQSTFLNPFGGNVSIGTDTPTGNILEVVQGSFSDPIADAWTVYSSRRLKTNIEPIEGALDKVRRLRGVSFDWKNSGIRDIGLIGEEVGAVIPEVVTYEENHQDAKSVDYSRLVAVLIEALKEQQEEIDGLKATLNSLTAHSGEYQYQYVAMHSH